MKLEDAVLGRRSIRAFRPDPVPPAVLQEIVECACWTPSAANTQPWEFTIVGGEPLQKLRSRLRSPPSDERSGYADDRSRDEHEQSEALHDLGDDMSLIQGVELLRTKDVRPVVLPPYEREQLIRRVGDVDGDVLRGSPGPSEADAGAEQVLSSPGEVDGEAERNGDLRDRAHHRGDQFRERVGEQVAEFVEPEIHVTEEGDLHAPHERVPPKDEAERCPGTELEDRARAEPGFVGRLGAHRHADRD
jgi:nitroreductase